MATVVYLLSALFFFLAFGCYLVVLMHAFRHSLKIGLLCFLIPPYTLFYYAFARFHHRRKTIILVFGILFGVLSLTGALTGHLFVEDDESVDRNTLDDW